MKFHSMSDIYEYIFLFFDLLFRYAFALNSYVHVICWWNSWNYLMFLFIFMQCCYEYLHKPLHQITNWNHIRYQAYTRVNIIINFTTWQYEVIFYSVRIEENHQIVRGKCIETLIWWTNIDSIFDTCLNKLMRKCICNK